MSLAGDIIAHGPFVAGGTYPMVRYPVVRYPVATAAEMNEIRDALIRDRAAAPSNLATCQHEIPAVRLGGVWYHPVQLFVCDRPPVGDGWYHAATAEGDGT